MPNLTSGPVLQTIPLDFQWATVDPFLFCVHHLDKYPEANEFMGPAASLEARDIGMDFEGADGWRMYHGSTVPGFPQHPHRGFETVTFVRQGYVDHSDSLGATARFGRGDVQWLTAGAGIVHCEMFPLLDRAGPEPLRAVPDLVEPAGRRQDGRPLLHDAVGPRDPAPQRQGRRGPSHGGDRHRRSPRGPTAAGAAHPNSWASRPEADVAIWHIVSEPGAEWTVPPAAAPDTVRTLYVFEGSIHVGDHNLEAKTGAVMRTDEPVTIAGGVYGAEALVLQGRPIGEPVAQYGPFVMNTKAEIEQAFNDYRATGFGGWPWPTDDPVHPRDAERFARHADGRVETT